MSEEIILDFRNALRENPLSYGRISTFLSYLIILFAGLVIIPSIALVIIFLIESNAEFLDYFLTFLVILIPSLLSFYFVWISTRRFLVKLNILSPTEFHHTLSFSTSDSSKDTTTLSGLTDILISVVPNSKSTYSFWVEENVPPTSLFTFVTFTVIHREELRNIGRFLLSPDKHSNSFVFYSQQSSCLQALQDAFEDVDVTTTLVTDSFSL